VPDRGAVDVDAHRQGVVAGAELGGRALGAGGTLLAGAVVAEADAVRG
jgi:hypothetical protein